MSSAAGVAHSRPDCDLDADDLQRGAMCVPLDAHERRAGQLARPEQCATGFQGALASASSEVVELLSYDRQERVCDEEEVGRIVAADSDAAVRLVEIRVGEADASSDGAPAPIVLTYDDRRKFGVVLRHDKPNAAVGNRVDVSRVTNGRLPLWENTPSCWMARHGGRQHECSRRSRHRRDSRDQSRAYAPHTDEYAAA